MNYQVNDNELVYMVNENYDEYFSVLLEKYKPIIMNNAISFYNTYKNLGVEIDDFLQEGIIGFYNAIKTYNEKNSVFYTYANICVRRSMISYSRKCNSIKYKCLNDSYRDEYLDSFKLKYEDPFLSNLYEYEFVNLKNMFSFEDSLVFELRYNGFSTREISNLLYIPFNRVSSILCKIKLNLKKTFYLNN